MKDRLLSLLEKIKNNKKIQILLLGFVVIVILLVYITYFVQGTNEEKTETTTNLYSTSTEEYINALEKKLEKVLANIEGAGKVDVAITVSSGFVYEYAYEETSKDTLSSSNASSNLILVDDEPIIISQTYPVIAGVLVVAEGGESLKVKLDILSSIQTLLDVANDDITILSGEF